METTHERPRRFNWDLSLNQRITLTISLVSLIISAGGFWLVYKQLKSNDEAVSMSTYLQTYGWTVDIDKAFIDDPKLKTYLYGDTATLNKTDTGFKKERAKVDAIADWMLDDYDAVLNNESYFKIVPDDGKLWMCTVSRGFHLSSILRAEFQKDSALFSPMLMEAYKQRDSIKTNSLHPCCAIKYEFKP